MPLGRASLHSGQAFGDKGPMVSFCFEHSSADFLGLMAQAQPDSDPFLG